MSPDIVFAAQMWPWPDPLVKRNTQGCVTFVNAAFLALFGGSVESWTGNVIPGWNAPNLQNAPHRFETRVGESPNQVIYDWVEVPMADGSAMAIARDVTALLSQYAAGSAQDRTLIAQLQSELSALKIASQASASAAASDDKSPAPVVKTETVSAPVQAAPVQAAPVQAAPVQAAPVQASGASAPMQPQAEVTAPAVSQDPATNVPFANVNTPLPQPVEPAQSQTPEFGLPPVIPNAVVTPETTPNVEQVETPVVQEPLAQDLGTTPHKALDEPIMESLSALNQEFKAAAHNPVADIPEGLTRDDVTASTVETPLEQSVPSQAIKEPERDFERRALPLENNESVLGSNWRDAVIARATGGEPEAEPKVVTPAAPIAKKSDDDAPFNILLAEDNAINALLTRTLLEAEGCVVETVEDGALAVNAVKNNEYDLILMDMRMPNMDGLEATRRIRALGGSKRDKLPIIALTANAFDDDRNACFDSGMNDFMTKPVSADELSVMVNNWVMKSRSEAA